MRYNRDVELYCNLFWQKRSAEVGGLGSGNWQRIGTKRTVDDSLTISISAFREYIDQKSRGVLNWLRRGKIAGSLGFEIADGQSDDEAILTLHYRMRRQGEVALSIQLESTPANFGGCRWWFNLSATVAKWRRLLPKGEQTTSPAWLAVFRLPTVS